MKNEINPSGGDGSGIAPIGHDVTVQSATEKSVKVTTTITYDEGYSFSTLKSQIEAAIEDYLLSLRKQWDSQTHSVVRISQIETRLLAITGIIDISNTKINGSTANLTCGEYEIPVFGGVS